MPIMSRVEAAFCRSAPWRRFAERVVLPRVLPTDGLHGSGVEIGGGSGAMAAAVLRREPGIELTVIDIDPAMMASAAKRLAPHGERVRTAVGSAIALPLGDSECNFVLSFLMLHHVIDWSTTQRGGPGAAPGWSADRL